MARIVKTGGSGSSPHIDRLMRVSTSSFSGQAVRRLEQDTITRALPAMSKIAVPISFSGVVTGALNRVSTLPNMASGKPNMSVQLLGGIRELMTAARPADASRKLSADLLGRMRSHFRPISPPSKPSLPKLEISRPSSSASIMRKAKR